jgi:hypothetical protein
VRTTRQAQIFSRPTVDPDSGNSYTAYFGCTLPRGAARQLAASVFPDLDTHTLFRLSGSYAAYVFGSACAGCDQPQTRVVVQSLRTGAIVHEVSFDDDPAVGPVLALVLARSGAAAFVDQRYADFGPGSVYEVRRISGNDSVVLDTSGRIVPRSLHLHGTKLTWRAGSRSRRARVSG